MGVWLVRERKTKILLGIFVEDRVARLPDQVSKCLVYRTPYSDDVEPEDADPADFEYCRVRSGAFVNCVFGENAPIIGVHNSLGQAGKFHLYPESDMMDHDDLAGWKPLPSPQ